MDDRTLALRYLPQIMEDEKEPFPIRMVGYTVFRTSAPSQSFSRLLLDPQRRGAACILEYAIYYDYDIQHLYDLEHIWVAVGEDGSLLDCWSSFHGMRLRAAGVPNFQVAGTHPVLYAQPGKHAMLPDPALFYLHPQFPDSCNLRCGGGLLIPDMLYGHLRTDPQQDARIDAHIRSRYAFTPSMRFRPAKIGGEQLMPWPRVLEKIPEYIQNELKNIP